MLLGCNDNELNGLASMHAPPCEAFPGQMCPAYDANGTPLLYKVFDTSMGNWVYVFAFNPDWMAAMAAADSSYGTSVWFDSRLDYTEQYWYINFPSVPFPGDGGAIPVGYVSSNDMNIRGNDDGTGFIDKIMIAVTIGALVYGGVEAAATGGAEATTAETGTGGTATSAGATLTDAETTAALEQAGNAGAAEYGTGAEVTSADYGAAAASSSAAPATITGEQALQYANQVVKYGGQAYQYYVSHNKQGQAVATPKRIATQQTAPASNDAGKRFVGLLFLWLSVAH